MTVTSTRRRGVSFSQVCHQQKFSPLEKIPLERVERELEGEERRAFILPVLSLHSCSTFLSFGSALRPPPLFPSSPSENGNTDAIWLEMAPCHPPPSFFLMTVRWLTFCWHNATKRDAEAFLSQVGGRTKKKADNTSAPPYLSKTPSCVGLGDIHLNASVAAASSIASSRRRFEVADQWQTVMLQPCCEGVTLSGMPLFVFLLSD